MKYLTNAFSANMLSIESLLAEAGFFPRLISEQQAREIAGEFRSVVGHADTAAEFSSLLDLEVPANRETVSLAVGDELLIGQYSGQRLPEGAKELPSGKSILWIHGRIEVR